MANWGAESLELSKEMARQTFTGLESQDFRDWEATPTLANSDWSVVVFILGLSLGWHLAGYRRRAAADPPATGDTANPEAEPDLEPQDLTELPFTQAIQWLAYGKDLEQADQYETAIAVYAEGLKRFPRNFRLWHEQGLALAKLQRFEEAIASYDRAYELRPRDPSLAHERGDTLLQLERYEEAITAFDIYLKYTPDSEHIRSDRGYALYQLGCYEEALQWLNPIVQSQSSDRYSVRHAHFYQINCLWQLGELETALKSCREAMRQYPDSCFKEQQEALRQRIADLTSDAEPSKPTPEPTLESAAAVSTSSENT
ncbi:tetratricopeptide repeat protein [Trichocoleus sp. FACHB-591]|uniref:tetratricopeptide repeat protein n=1 Tax=Trichocoleus sp. FACHB-591 TaxID=2692872 RepID=UPI001688A6A2|nr:tetratricopeptide repeat protein [Trichocoleus sp. FACHB-591]